MLRKSLNDDEAAKLRGMIEAANHGPAPCADRADHVLTVTSGEAIYQQHPEDAEGLMLSAWLTLKASQMRARRDAIVQHPGDAA